MKEPTIFLRKRLSTKHLMFAIWTLGRKHKRAAHFIELTEYLACSVNLLRYVLWMLDQRQEIRISADNQFYTIRDNTYLPLQ